MKNLPPRHKGTKNFLSRLLYGAYTIADACLSRFEPDPLQRLRAQLDLDRAVFYFYFGPRQWVCRMPEPAYPLAKNQLDLTFRLLKVSNGKQ